LPALHIISLSPYNGSKSIVVPFIFNEVNTRRLPHDGLQWIRLDEFPSLDLSPALCLCPSLCYGLKHKLKQFSMSILLFKEMNKSG
jgi:hypothetical protein